MSFKNLIIRLLLFVIVISSISFFSIPAFALDKFASDYNVLQFWWPEDNILFPGYVGIVRHLGFSYYYSGSGYYATAVVYSHQQGGAIKYARDPNTWPYNDGFSVDATGRNRYYAQGNFVAQVQIPYVPSWVDPRDKDWGGYIWTTVNVWPAVNDSCQGVMEVFANALPYYGSRTLTINF